MSTIETIFPSRKERINLSSDIERKAGRAIGRVQGVGFRMFVRAEATKRGVTGWVKNMSDGAVTMELQGAPNVIAELVERIKKGRNRIKVTKLELNDLPVVEGEDKFAIRR